MQHDLYLAGAETTCMHEKLEDTSSNLMKNEFNYNMIQTSKKGKSSKVMN